MGYNDRVPAAAKADGLHRSGKPLGRSLQRLPSRRHQHGASLGAQIQLRVTLPDLAEGLSVKDAHIPLPQVIQDPHDPPKMTGSFHRLPSGTGEYGKLHAKKQRSRFVSLLHPENAQPKILPPQANRVPVRKIRLAMAQKEKRSHGIPRIQSSLVLLSIS